MHDPPGPRQQRGRVGAEFGGKPVDRVDHPDRGVLGRALGLGEGQRAVVGNRDHVGEGAADVDTDAPPAIRHRVVVPVFDGIRHGSGRSRTRTGSRRTQQCASGFFQEAAGACRLETADCRMPGDELHRAAAATGHDTRRHSSSAPGGSHRVRQQRLVRTVRAWWLRFGSGVADTMRPGQFRRNSVGQQAARCFAGIRPRPAPVSFMRPAMTGPDRQTRYGAGCPAPLFRRPGPARLTAKSADPGRT